ncbi:transcriptional protein SWT1-like [Pseudoliparis swirei]|uniref:transcriptional protein SWT1-like n=1 Tax=Pseudoliparis swirei TaxID=2059687 RepID=UPI0024BEB82E|nr:transcriptional protein SWT1-like [Pseudoliparis swirei]
MPRYADSSIWLIRLLRKMSKQSKKRKHLESSSSSEEDTKSSKEQEVSENYKRVTRNHAEKKSSAAKQEKCSSSTVKDPSQSTRHIKGAADQLLKTRDPKQSVYKPEECSKPKRELSDKHKTVRGKTLKKKTSKPSNNAGAVAQRTEKTPKGGSDTTSAHRRKSKFKKLRVSLDSAEQKERTRKSSAGEPPRTEGERWTLETRGPSAAASVSQDSSSEKKIDLFRKMCQRHRDEKAKRSRCTEVTSSSTTGTASSSSKQKVSSSDAVKNVRTIPGTVPSMSRATVKSSVQEQICRRESPLRFKIPKKSRPTAVGRPGNDDAASSSNGNVEHGAEPSGSRSNAAQRRVQPAPRCSGATPGSSPEGQERSCPSHAITELRSDQMQVVEQLTRSGRRLEVNVLQVYGELTCMDIDPPREGAADSLCKQAPRQDLLVLDTNILISHLDYVKEIKANGLGAVGFPIVLIPWVVLQELDSLKKGRGTAGSVAHLAAPAMSYINACLKKREPELWGQSMQQDVASSNNTTSKGHTSKENRHEPQQHPSVGFLPPSVLSFLSSNDKNLCSKALLSGVNALSKNDLEDRRRQSRHGLHPPQHTHTLTHSHTPARPRSREGTGRGSGLPVEGDTDSQQLRPRDDEEETRWVPSRRELADCLVEVLSDVLELEMKAVFEDLWLEIVFLKPPWTLHDVLRCLKKHWIAVFGQVAPRRQLDNVLHLIDFFNSGQTATCDTMAAAVRQAKELVNVFRERSRLVPGAVSTMENMDNALRPPCEAPARDVDMNDTDEEEPPRPPAPHQEVWALFETTWARLSQRSLEVFRVLGFDHDATQRPVGRGGPPPPQDAVVCLHELRSVVAQLLRAFSSVLTAGPGLEEGQALLSILRSNKIVDMDSRLTATDLLDCFSREDYREKLMTGGNQLTGLKEVLDRCIGTTAAPP